ncbi:MAG: hypothetical protein HC842_09055 [Cytophagales bacterium]|nr:hypothetical protein [Cytophagales bacterium]
MPWWAFPAAHARRPDFWVALLAQAVVLALHLLTLQDRLSLGYLWYNVIGAALVVVGSLALTVRSHS